MSIDDREDAVRCWTQRLAELTIWELSQDVAYDSPLSLLRAIKERVADAK